MASERFNAILTCKKCDGETFEVLIKQEKTGNLSKEKQRALLKCSVCGHLIETELQYIKSKK